MEVEKEQEATDRPAGWANDWRAEWLSGWRNASKSEVDAALCHFAEALTAQPGAMQEQDIEHLRGLGLDDVAIHDAIQVIAYFNYINRIADATHVDLDPGMPAYPAAD